MMELGLSRNQIIAELSKSPHGKLEQYVPVIRRAAEEDPEFLAHIISWNREKGEVRDAKVGIPLVPLSVARYPFADNSFAHLCTLAPGSLLQGWKFARSINVPRTTRRTLRWVIRRYLQDRENKFFWWSSCVVQDRDSVFQLYKLAGKKPAKFAEDIFNGIYAPGTAFADLKMLPHMSDHEAAVAIVKHKFPFMILPMALGDARLKKAEPELMMSIIDRMTPAETVNHAKWLQAHKVQKQNITKVALDQAIRRAGDKKNRQTLKTVRAIAAVDDPEIKEKLRALQAVQIKKSSSIEGDWLVLADKSQSMAGSIELGRHLAATLAKMVRGTVRLVFFDVAPHAFAIPAGMDYDKVLERTRHVHAAGGTCIGAGLMWAAGRIQAKQLNVDGIAIVSDGGENHYPSAAEAYNMLCGELGRRPPIYFYRVPGGDPDCLSRNMQFMKIGMETFNIPQGFDYYSLPNLAQTMRVDRYSLLDEIMATPLLTLADVLDCEKKKEPVLAY